MVGSLIELSNFLQEMPDEYIRKVAWLPKLVRYIAAGCCSIMHGHTRSTELVAAAFQFWHFRVDESIFNIIVICSLFD